MKVFLSWSGEQSRAVAEALAKWLPRVLQNLRPWMSEHDIQAGTVWGDELSSQLDEAAGGILCLTPESVKSAWLLFESGALSRAMGEKRRVIPYRLNLAASEVPSPLQRFQGMAADRAGTWGLLRSLNAVLTPPLDDRILEEAFAVWWPRLEERLDEIGRPEAPPARPQGATEPPAFFFSEPAFDRDVIEVIRRALAPGDGEGDGPASPSELNRLEDLDGEDVWRRRGLFVSIPYWQRFSESLIARLVDWVRDGGRLVATGYELGERHHGTNINQLLYYFGIHFNSDVVFGQQKPTHEGDKNYDVSLLFDSFVEPKHRLFEGVEKIALKRACSLHLEPGAVPLLRVFPNRLRELAPESARYSADKDYALAAYGEQKFEAPYVDEDRAVIALAPSDLTGKGQVLALGTWNFQDGRQPCDNDRFIKNVWRWMTGDAGAGPSRI